VYILYVLNKFSVLKKFWCKLPKEDDNAEATEKYTDCGTVHLLCVTEVWAGHFPVLNDILAAQYRKGI
jgi:hypothetical protein